MGISIFVSSRMRVQPEDGLREVAYEVIRRVGCCPVLFEREPGSPNHFRDWWRGKIRECDFFLVILNGALSPAVFDEVSTAREHSKQIFVATVDHDRLSQRSLVVLHSHGETLHIPSDSDVNSFYRWMCGPKAIPATDPATFKRELEAALWSKPLIASGLPGELRRIENVFVPPAEYDDAKARLLQHRLAIIAGPPHIGKTATSLHLAMTLRDELNLRTVERISPGEDIARWQSTSGSVIVIDDCFGESVLSRGDRADRFQDLVILAQHNYVIVSTRSEILAEARQTTRLRSDHTLDRFLVQLEPEGSYDWHAREALLNKHLWFAQSELVPEANRITAEQARLAQAHTYRILERLRFPHNVERLCLVHLRQVTSDGQLWDAVKAAKEIEEETKRWADNLDPPDKWFAFVVALFPAVERDILRTIYRTAANRLGFYSEDIQRLAQIHCAYISDPTRPAYGHPSYQEAIIALLHENYETSVGQIVDSGLREIAKTDVFAFARCADADYGWPRLSQRDPLPIDDYLEQLVDVYDRLRSGTFSQLRSKLAPYLTDGAAAWFLVRPNSRGGTLLIVPRTENDPRVHVERPQDMKKRVESLMEGARNAGQPLEAIVTRADDLAHRSPQMHALELIRDGIEETFTKQRLQESWQMAVGRIEISLRHLNVWREFDIDWKTPFDWQKLQALSEAFERLSEAGPPAGFHPEGWERSMATHARHLIALDKALKILDQHQKQYNGPLLPEPDQPRGGYVCYSYSLERMKQAIQTYFESALDSYRWMVENNFKTLADRMDLYRHLPVKVLGAVSYGPHFDLARSEFYFLPYEFPTVGNQAFEVYVTTSDNCDDDEAPAFSEEAENRLAQAESQNWISSFGTGPECFCSLRELIKEVYEWLQRDVDNAMGWSKVGSGRTQFLQTRGGSHSDILDFKQMQDAWDFFDWPTR